MSDFRAGRELDSSQQRDRRQWAQIAVRGILTRIRKNIFTMRVVKHWVRGSGASIHGDITN